MLQHTRSCRPPSSLRIFQFWFLREEGGCHDKNYFSIISNSSLRVYPVSFGHSTGGTIVAKELGKVWVFSSPEALAVLKGGMGGIPPGFTVLVASRDPAHEKKIIEKKNFLFPAKERSKKKKINVSQLAIRYFNDVTEKRMYPPCFFIFTCFSLETKFLRDFLWKQKHFNQTFL